MLQQLLKYKPIKYSLNWYKLPLHAQAQVLLHTTILIKKQNKTIKKETLKWPLGCCCAFPETSLRIFP